MSTLKSSAEDLTLNADGSGNDVIIQSNASTKAIVTAEGDVGIGTDSPDEKLHVMESSAGSVTAHTESSIVAERSGNSFISVLGTLNSGVLFGDAGGNETGRIIYNFGSDYMKFNIANTERMRVTANGITFNGDTAAANALDDYEEGTWTPTDASGAGLTYSVAAGFYTKIGRLVTVHFNVGYPTTSNASVALISLPFTAGSTVYGGLFSGGLGYTTYGSLNLLGISGAAHFGFTDTTGSGSQLTNANVSAKAFRGTFTYFV